MAQIFYYELPADLEDWDEYDDELPVEVVQTWLDNHPEVRANIRRGDILRLPDMYRNNATFIWDGSKVTPLSFDEDEYGNVPRGFFVLDPADGPAPGQMFGLDHWMNKTDDQVAIDHNDYVWIRLTPEEIQQVKAQRTHFSRKDEMYYFSISIRGFDFYFASEKSKVQNWKLNKPLCVSTTNWDGYCDSHTCPVVLVDM